MPAQSPMSVEGLIRRLELHLVNARIAGRGELSLSARIQLSKVERVERQREATGFDLLEIQESSIECRQALSLPVDDLEVVPSSLLVQILVAAGAPRSRGRF